MTIQKRQFIALCLSALCTSAATAQNAAWPPATVKIVVPYPPGTEPDVLARDLSAALARQTGKTFVIENKPGANSIIGSDVVAKSEPDGSTLLLVDRLAVATNPVLYAKMPYRWEDALRPLTDLASVNLYLAVRDGFPARTYAEFLAWAKANPGKVTIGTGGNGHVNHIAAAMVAQAHGLDFTFVPYKGVGPALLALQGAEVDAVLAGGLVMKSATDSKRARVLVSGAAQRSTVLPDVPLLAEAGGKAGSIPSTVFALFAPGKLSDATAQQISKAVASALGTGEVKQTYANKGLDLGFTTPAAGLGLLKQDSAKYERIIRDAGIRLE